MPASTAKARLMNSIELADAGVVGAAQRTRGRGARLSRLDYKQLARSRRRVPSLVSYKLTRYSRRASMRYDSKRFNSSSNKTRARPIMQWPDLSDGVRASATC